MECLAVIPARGGSKGIPRKNVRLLAGKPLLAHSIEQALLARYVTRVVVSTDDEEIAAVARRFGAEVVWRPADLSGDRASSESALLHALETLKAAEGYVPDVLVFMQCTSPLTIAADIDGTVAALLADEADSAAALAPFHYYIWRDGPHGPEGINHDKYVRPMRQDLQPQYIETGAVYALRVPGFIQARHRFFGKITKYVMPLERRLEIDDPVDFQVAEVMLQEQQRQRRLQALPETIEAIVFDFDGVFTDNRVLVTEDGREAVLCDRADGWGIGQLKKTGIPLLVLSTEKNPVVRARSEKMGLPCLQGIGDKGAALAAWLVEQDLDPANVIYVGNDVNDLPCMQQVGCVVVVADARPEVKQLANLVLERPGGQGAVRELCDLILDRAAYHPLRSYTV